MRRLSVVSAPVFALLVGLAALSACQPGPAPTAGPGPVTPLNPDVQVTVVTFTPAPATPVPTATQAAYGPYGPDSYPADVNPLTGLPVDDPAVLARAPLAIKVSNDPLSRPQSGLSFADLVFEHYAEGGVTRFTAVYYSRAPEIVGSVRSGRLIDLEIPVMYDAVFAASGFSDGVRQRMNQAAWANRNFSGPFYGEPVLVRIAREGLALEHTMFAVPEELWKLAAQQGVNQPPVLTPGMAFASQPPAGGTPASRLTFDFSQSLFRVDWDYDPASGRYVRSQAGEPHIDYLTNAPLAVENVVAVGAWHIETDILEDGYNGLWSVEIQIWGEGPLSVFRDGQRFEGKWTRTNPEQMLQFWDMSGNPLYLKPGQTWFEMVPIGFDRLTVTP